MSVRIKIAGLLAAGALAAVVAACSSGSSGSEATEYQVTVNFTEEVTQDDMDSVGDFLRGFDPDVDFLIQEIFPPIGSARVSTDEEGFCQTVKTDLGARSYVSDVRCEPYVAPADDGDPDEPVSDEPNDIRY
jgi:hypothetical protein